MAILKNNSEIINDEFWLPDVVIQHIQSFMSGKEAVRTSILSKSWHAAWSTRPNLNFSQVDFFQLGWDSWEHMERFLESAMQRYEQSNLRIESFCLTMDRRRRDNCLVADELIARALKKLGATELSLAVCFSVGSPEFMFTDAWDLRNLMFLHLKYLNIDPLFSFDSSCEFPSLKVLTLYRCRTKKEILRISGPSLERMSFARSHTCSDFSNMALDVPNIRKFTFSGGFRLPSLSFEATANMDWVSDLSIDVRMDEFKTSWFLELEKFLEELSQSKITLNLEIDWAEKVVYDYANQGKPVVVEKLTVKLYEWFINGDHNVMEYLFRSVEPNFITQFWEDLQRPRSKRNGDIFLEFFCKALDKSSVEEVNVECFEETRAEWRPLSLNTLLGYALTSPDDKQEIRFRLKWRVL